MRFESTVSVKLRDAYRARTEPESVRILGVFYWSLLIIILSVFVVGGIGYGSWEFMQPQMSTPESSVVIPPKKVFTKTGIQKILQGLDDRSREYDRRAKAAPVLKDPS